MRRWARYAVLTSLLLSPLARAEENPTPTPAAPATPDAAHLQKFLDTVAWQGHDGRLRSAVVCATAAAVVAPPGVFLVTRGDPGVQIAGVTVVMQAVFYLSCLVDAASPSSLETLKAHRDQRAAQGKDPATVVSETESEWNDAVQQGRRRRLGWGLAGLVVGGLEAAAGMYLLVADPVFTGWDRQQQTIWGTVIAGVGVPAFVSGLWQILTTTSSLEDWRTLYESSKAGPTSALARPSFMMATSAHGAIGSLGFVF
jgi:hypothetical protein